MFEFLRNVKLAFDISYVMFLTFINICVPVVIGTIKNELKKIEADIIINDVPDLSSDSSVQSEESRTCEVVEEHELEDEVCSK